MAFNAYQQPYNYQYGNQNYNNLPSYGNYQQQYVQQPQYQQVSQQYQTQPVQQQYTQPQQPMIYGKVVESIDIVKNQEIPIGATYVFPQANMEKIFIKAWNQDGSTKVITYSPIVNEEKQEQKNEYADALSNIQKQIEELDKKVSTLV